MISVSSAFLDAIYNKDIRSFIYGIAVSLQDGTFLSLNNDAIYNGGVSVEDSVSEDSTLQTGSAIINKLTLALINYDGRYDIYDFTDARIAVTIGLKINGSIESFQRGVYIVTEQDYNNSLLTLTCLDNMSLFERPYSETMLQYPASLLEIVQDACTACGVEMAAEDFPNCTAVIQTKPDLQGITFRDIISWASQCAGCFAKIDNYGKLEIRYYDFALLDSITEEQLDELMEEIELATESDEVLTTESGEDIILDRVGFKYFPYLYTINTGYNDTTITGIRVCIENPGASGPDDAILEYTSGTEAYELLIENNQLITTENAQEIADFLGTQLIGATYRKANYTHLGDPTVTAGDVAIVKDGHGHLYRTVVSSTTFTSGDRQNTVSAGANPPRIPNQPPQYSVAVRITQDGEGRIVQNGNIRSAGRITQNANTRRMLRSAPTSSYNAVTRYSEITKQAIRRAKALQNEGGLYYTAVEDGSGGIIHVLHDKPSLDVSNIRMVFSTDGIMVTANGLDADPDWFGLEVDGDLIANILQANGINADWITAGTIHGVVIETVPSEATYVGTTGTYYVRFAYSEAGMRMELVPTPESEGATYMSSKSSIIEPYMSTETIFDQEGNTITVDYPMARIHNPVFDNDYNYIGFYNELCYGTFSEIASLTSYTSETLSKPSSLTNFSFGDTWDCWVRRKGSVVTIGYNFNGHFTSTSSTGGTLFELPSVCSPIAYTRYINAVNESGVRYLLTINTNGTVTLQNTQGAAASDHQFFRGQITFVK